MEKVRLRYYEYPTGSYDNDIIDAEFVEREEKPKVKEEKKKKSKVVPILSILLIIALLSLIVQGYVMYRQHLQINNLNGEIEQKDIVLTQLNNEIETKEVKIKELSDHIAKQEESLEEKSEENTNLELRLQEQEDRYNRIAQTISATIDRSSYLEISSYNMLEKMSNSLKNRQVQITGYAVAIDDAGDGIQDILFSLNGSEIKMQYHYDAIGVTITQGIPYRVYGRVAESEEDGMMKIDVDYVEKFET